MIHPHTELRFISPQVGYGVVATQKIPAGTITWALDKLDRTFTFEEFEALDPLYQEILDTYTYRNNKGQFVLCWDNGRFVNHSFKSNCLTTAYDFELAIRDIEAGTQRKVVYPDDLLRYHKAWDKKLLNVFPKVPKLEQPLKALFSEEAWKNVLAIANNKTPMRSILENYFPNEAAIAERN